MLGHPSREFAFKAINSGVITTEEIKLAETSWIKVTQIEIDEEINEFPLHKTFRCYGKLSFYHPIFIPRRHLLAEKIVEM